VKYDLQHVDKVFGRHIEKGEYSRSERWARSNAAPSKVAGVAA